MASFRKAGRKWQSVTSIMVDGARVQRCSTFATQAEAKAHAAKLTLLEQRGIGAVKVALGEYPNDWIAAKANQIEQNTLAG